MGLTENKDRVRPKELHVLLLYFGYILATNPTHQYNSSVMPKSLK